MARRTLLAQLCGWAALCSSLAACGPSGSGDLAIAHWDCRLAWDYAGVPAEFRVYSRGEGEMALRLVGTTTKPTARCVTLGIVGDNQRHYFRVTAWANQIESPFSNEVSKVLVRKGG